MVSLNSVIKYVLARITLGNTSTRFDFVCNFVKYINENGYVVANCKLTSYEVCQAFARLKPIFQLDDWKLFRRVSCHRIRTLRNCFNRQAYHKVPFCKLISSQFSEKINFSITLRTTAVSSLTKSAKNDIFYKIMGSFRGSINEMCS